MVGTPAAPGRGDATPRPVPLAFAIAAVALAQLVTRLDRDLSPDAPITYSSDSAQTTLSSIASGMLVFIGFVFSVITFAIQYEASTYTPRLLRTVADSTAMRITLGVFIATFVLFLLAQIDGVHRDRTGKVRVLVPMATWEDYLDLALTEIRLYGAGSPFVVREMRRVLDDVHRLAPPSRRPSVERQRELLDGAVGRTTPRSGDPTGRRRVSI